MKTKSLSEVSENLSKGACKTKIPTVEEMAGYPDEFTPSIAT